MISIHDLAYGKDIWRRFFDEGRLRVETDGCKLDGTKIRIEGDYICLYDDQERISGHFGVQRDVTERRRQEAENNRLLRAVEVAAEAVTITDSDGMITYANPPVHDLFGYENGELIGQHVSVLNAGSPQDAMRRVFDMVAGIEREGFWRGEITNKRMDGTQFTSLASITALKRSNGEIENLILLQQDITERKQTEKAMIQYQEKLKMLTSQLALAEERQRRKIAERLHDEIIQNLIFMKIQLDSLRKGRDKANLTDSVDELQGRLDELVETTRSLTFELGNPALYTLGFETAVEQWLHTEIRDKQGLAVEFRDDGSAKPIDDDLRGFLFRAVRELLINVVKHADASGVTVSVSTDEGNVVVSVEDDGRGNVEDVAKNEISGKKGFGLFSIRERLDYLGGNLDIISETGRGTRVVLSVPLGKDAPLACDHHI